MLLKSISRVERDEYPDLQKQLLVTTGNGQKGKLALPTLNGYELVDAHDVVWCEADINYTTFHICSRGKIMISKSLKEVSAILEPYGFVRLHKHHLVNLRYAVRYIKGMYGQLVLTDGTVLSVSHRNKNALLERLKIIC